MKSVFLKTLLSAAKFPAFLILALFFIFPIYICFNVDALQNTLADMFSIGTMLSMIGSFFSLSMHFGEEATGWNKFLLTTPVTRKQIINSKYLMTAVMSVLYILMSTLPSVVLMIKTTGFDFREWLFIFSALTGICIFMLSFTIPISVKFGNIAGSVIFVIVFMAILSGVVIASALLGKNEEILSAANGLIHTDKYIISAAILSVCVVLTVISLLISRAVYKKKEF